MSKQTQVTIGRTISFLLTLAFSFPTIASLFPADTLTLLQAKVPAAIEAAGVLASTALFIWHLWPRSAATKVALAAELPQVSRIVTTDALAVATPVSKLTDAQHPASIRTVVTFAEAAKTPPPMPSTPY